LHIGGDDQFAGIGVRLTDCPFEFWGCGNEWAASGSDDAHRCGLIGDGIALNVAVSGDDAEVFVW
jgi:hypothetical protein